MLEAAANVLSLIEVRDISPPGEQAKLFWTEPQAGFSSGLPAKAPKPEPINYWQRAVQAIIEARHNPETARALLALASHGLRELASLEQLRATDLQRDALIAVGVDAAHLYEDHASGKREDRPGLAACLKALRSGDTLVMWKLDRLGRDLRPLMHTVHDLTRRGIGRKVLTGHGAAIDTTTAAGRLVFGIFAALAEFERELSAERTVAGLASARARGRKGGRPFKMTAAKLRLAMAAMGQPETKAGE
jgi:DNA invertase Pin-like site-specific DNA recombinase